LLLSFFLAFVESPLACYVVQHRWLWHYTTAKCCRLLKIQRSWSLGVLKSKFLSKVVLNSSHGRHV